MTDEADKAGRVRQSVTAALLAALMCLSASAQTQTVIGRVVGVSVCLPIVFVLIGLLKYAYSLVFELKDCDFPFLNLSGKLFKELSVDVPDLLSFRNLCLHRF